jgi:DNA-binding MarR family transcriptional regulator
MNERLEQPGPRYRALLEWLRASEAVWHASQAFFGRWELSPSQFNILNLLGDQPAGLSQTELSRELITHRSNVTGLVDRLEKRELVTRRESATDRRAWRVTLTARGKALLQEILPQYYAVAEEVWGDVNVKRAETMATAGRLLEEQALRIAQRYQGKES